jgi:hypothetical protein
MEDLLVLQVAEILQYGSRDSMSIDVSTIGEAEELLKAGENTMKLGFLPSVDGKTMHIHAIIGQERIGEWNKWMLGSTKMGQA